MCSKSTLRFFHAFYPRRSDQNPAPILDGREVGFDLFMGDLAVHIKDHPQ